MLTLCLFSDLQDLTALNGGTIPESDQLQDEKTQLEVDLDGLGGEDPAVIQKYERAKAEVCSFSFCSGSLTRDPTRAYSSRLSRHALR